MKLERGLNDNNSLLYYWSYKYRTVYVLLLIVCAGVAAKEITYLQKEASEQKQSAIYVTTAFNDFLHGGVIVAADNSFAAKCENLIEVTN